MPPRVALILALLVGCTGPNPLAIGPGAAATRLRLHVPTDPSAPVDLVVDHGSSWRRADVCLQIDRGGRVEVVATHIGLSSNLAVLGATAGAAAGTAVHPGTGTAAGGGIGAVVGRALDWLRGPAGLSDFSARCWELEGGTAPPPAPVLLPEVLPPGPAGEGSE